MYRDLEVTLDLSGLGDGCKVVIRNPKLLPPKALRPAAVEMKDGAPVDPAAAEKAMHDLMGSLVRSWTVWDSETGNELPTPAEDPNVWDSVPMAVVNEIAVQIGEAVNPQ